MECDISSLPSTHPDCESHVFGHILTPQSIGSDVEVRPLYENQFDQSHFLLGAEVQYNLQSGPSGVENDKLSTSIQSIEIARSRTTSNGDASDLTKPCNGSQLKLQSQVNLSSCKRDKSSLDYQKWQHDLSITPAAKRSWADLPASPVSIPRTPSAFSLRKRSRTAFMSSTPPKAASISEAPPRVRSSIPSFLPPEEYSRQCVLAAYSSRLNPYSLHPGEYESLKDRITELQTTLYLNIRNGILRLWTRNPLVTVTIEEALGCAKDIRYFGLATFAHEWLTRQGYINFGCVETYGLQPVRRGRGQLARPKTIVVIGAGISGLTCARQLQGLFRQFENRLVAIRRENMPRIIMLEGRSRIGGRVYSRLLRSQKCGSLPENLRNTAEMGAQIITGFEHGNPLNIVVRGQLALDYHCLKDNLVLCDFDGVPIDERRDDKIQKLYNEILEHASTHSWESVRKIMTGSHECSIEDGEDFSPRQDPCRMSLEQGEPNESNINQPTTDSALPIKNSFFMTNHFPVDDANTLASLNGESSTMLGPLPSSCQGVATAGSPPTLGGLMDGLVAKYQASSGLSPQEMRLLNWHYANLEYSNAVNVDQLSLGGWDQDGGNEFEGPHAEVVGGYSQVAQGLAQYPSPLEIHFNKVVKHVQYSPLVGESKPAARVVCNDGEVVDADHVVVTLPLGVLKSNRISFEPDLPKSKKGALERLGFGLLNKIILVFESVFWEQDRDMFGMLNQPLAGESLKQEDYVSQRGKFYLFWNCIKTSGRPMLVALMAGDAAHEAEQVTDQILIEQVTTKLAKAFSLPTPPVPQEAIVTRWKKDPFALGTYSYLGPDAEPGDYDRMADAVGNLHFAGEATCGTHPATVHGALLSGLRAASEVVESMLGPISAPETPASLTPKRESVPNSILQAPS